MDNLMSLFQNSQRENSRTANTIY